MTLDRAAELLAEKRAKGPTPSRRTTKKAPAKKTAAKKKAPSAMAGPATKKSAAKSP